MSYSEIWENLSQIDCSKHIQKKGNLSFLSWTYAWGTLMAEYPDATFDVHPERTLENGTVECGVTLTIGECSRFMWLPVMDFKNNSVVNPDTRAISDSRMRTLVKCMALFGLGFYIYAGEDVPEKREPVAKVGNMSDHFDAICAIKAGLIESADNEDGFQDLESAAEAWFTIDGGKDTQRLLWIAPSRGGSFTTREREIMKSFEFKRAYTEEKGL